MLDGVLRSVSYFILLYKFIDLNTCTGPNVFNTLKALSSLSGWSSLKLIKLNIFRLINFNGFANNSLQRVKLTNYMSLMKVFRSGQLLASN